MTLILCPECNNKISDRAISCPSCGFPIASQERTLPSEVTDIPNDAGVSTIIPEIHADIDLGHVIHGGGDGTLKGYYNRDENVVSLGDSCKVYVWLVSRGIKIVHRPSNEKYKLHKKQIISISQSDRNKLLSNETDVRSQILKNAIVGGVIFGPAGAVVGGILGSNSKQNSAHKMGDGFLVINYLDIDTKEAKTLLISGKSDEITAFVKLYQDEVASGKAEDELKAKSKESTTTPGCLIAIIVAVFLGLFFVGVLS